MATIWVISDTHFGHANMLQFKREDGTPMRPFASVEEMDETIIDRWNAVVRPQDHVYHLGDVAMKQQCVATVARCHGHKRLVRGNHDIYKTKTYLREFEEIYGVRVLEGLIMSHIPLHPESLGATRWSNVHGHLHNNATALHLGPRYLNVCVEMLEYRPITLEEVRELIAKQKEDAG